MQMLQQPDKITFLYLRNHEFRHVRFVAAEESLGRLVRFGDIEPPKE